MFQSAYAAYQTVAIALELVVRELRRNDQYNSKYGRFWRLAQRTANRAIEATYVTMQARNMRNIANLPLVSRNIVPRRVRCMTMESRRDVRDWVILRSSLEIADFYLRTFQLFVQQNPQLNVTAVTNSSDR